LKSGAEILIIDDDQDFVEISKLALAGKGYRIRAAGSTPEAWKLLERKPPDLIILDLMMERLDSGMDLGQRIKNHPRLCSVPILMLSSISRETGMDFTPQTPEDLMQMHVDDFSTKPVKAKVLIEKVERLLALRGARKEGP
jgi:CheY-like chemotaxis protein